MIKSILNEMKKQRQSPRALRDNFVWWLSQNGYIEKYQDFIETLNIGDMSAKIHYDNTEGAVVIQPESNSRKLIGVVQAWLNDSGFEVANKGPAIITYRDNAGNQVYYDPRNGVVNIEGYAAE